MIRSVLVFLLFFVVGAALLVGLIFGTYAVKPWFVNKNYQITRNSQQYVTSKQTELNGLLQDWQRLDAAQRAEPDADVRADEQRQQTYDVNQMQQAASLIRPEQVPADVAAFLRTH